MIHFHGNIEDALACRQHHSVRHLLDGTMPATRSFATLDSTGQKKQNQNSTGPENQNKIDWAKKTRLGQKNKKTLDWDGIFKTKKPHLGRPNSCRKGPRMPKLRHIRVRSNWGSNSTYWAKWALLKLHRSRKGFLNEIEDWRSRYKVCAEPDLDLKVVSFDNHSF